MISPAFWLVRGNEFKITRSDDPIHTPLLRTTGNCLGGQTFRSKEGSGREHPLSPTPPPPPLYVRGLINEHFQWSVNVEFASRRLAKMTFFAVKSHCFELMD